MSDSQFKILTYNIHKGFSASNNRFILHGIKAALQEVNADVLFLQEIQGKHRRHSLKIQSWPEKTQFEYLAGSIWPHYSYGKNAIYNNGHHGNAILSKYEFIEWENINVSLMKSASRSLLHGILKNECLNVRLHVICVHLGLFGRERDMQLARLIKRIDSHVPHQEPLIIAGDFNDWRGKAEHYLGHVLGVSEVFKEQYGHYAQTFPAWFPVLPMDRIYSRGLKVEDCYSLNEHHWRRLSDHLPLVSVFSLI